MNTQAFSQSAHAVYKLQYHLVLVTKYRRKVLTDPMLSHLERTARARVEAWNGRILEINGESDHVHMLIELPPSIAISDFVNALKTATSRLLRRDFPELKARYRKPPLTHSPDAMAERENTLPACDLSDHKGLWSRSWFIASCGGAPLEAIKAYIQAQDRPQAPHPPEAALPPVSEEIGRSL